MSTKRLKEIDRMRAASILLLVAYHSFAIFAGNWQYPYNQSITPPRLYSVIGDALSRVSFQPFLFMSGYLFACQLSTNKWNLKKLVSSKVKRLLLPSIVFSFLYCLCFDYPWNIGWIESIIFGAGHLWFLPILFGCFVLGFFLFRQKTWIVVAFCVLTLIFSQNNFMPHYVNHTLQCFVYFTLGSIIFKFRCSKKWCLTAAGVMAIAMVIGFVLHQRGYENAYLYFLVSISSIGCIVIYVLCRIITLDNVVIKLLSQSSMGIYIYHQFILIAMIYHSALIYVASVYVLPWILFVVTLPASFLLSRFSLKIPVLNKMI